MMDFPANFDLIMQPESAYCFVSASHRFNLPPEALLSQAMVEGGKVGEVASNKNGSFDLGIMQVNTLWLKEASPLKSYLNFTSLANDICTNAHTAAWILSSLVLKTGGDIWKAVGMYHNPSKETLAKKYIQKVNYRLPLARQILATAPEYQKYINMFYKSENTTFSQDKTISVIR